MTKRIKYGIIGTGTMGREHIRNIDIIDEAEVVALCDTNKNSIDQSLSTLVGGAETFSDLDNLIEANLVDAYIVATPNFTHIDILKKIIKTNAHLLIEKPLCRTVKDCKEFTTLTKDYPSIIWTGMQYRYMLPIDKMIKEIQNKTIGNLHMLSIREHRFPFLEKVDDWNRFSTNTGGTLVEKCCHFFDLMRFISQSEAVKVYASGKQDINHLNEKYGGKTPDIIDNAYVIVDFENGVRSLLDLCMFAENSTLQEELCAVGSKGKIETGVPSNESGMSSSDLIIRFRKNRDYKREIIEVDKKILDAGYHHGSTYYEHKAFINAIQNNLLPEISLNDGLMAVAIGEAAELSIKENRVVMMNEFNLSS